MTRRQCVRARHCLGEIATDSAASGDSANGTIGALLDLEELERAELLKFSE